MAKSAKNFYTLADITKRGFDPLAFRYLVLGAHYRSKLNFTWESLGAAASALESLRQLMYRPAKPLSAAAMRAIDTALADDLNLPVALGILHAESNPALWEHYDVVLGLGLHIMVVDVPSHIRRLLTDREAARKAGDYGRADILRQQIHQAGFMIEDTPDGPVLIPRP